MTTSNELDSLLERARSASGIERAELRRPLAGFGLAALERLRPWLADEAIPPRLQWFAVGVVRELAVGYRKEALETLRRAAQRAPDADARRDAQRALLELGEAQDRQTVPGTQRLIGPRPVTRSAGARWPGFQEHEFGYVKGTRWRSRDGSESLAPLLVTQLRYRHPEFESFPVERMPQLHFALPSRYQVPMEHEQGIRASKLVVYALGPTGQFPSAPAEVVAGWYIEKGDGTKGYGEPERELFDWPFLIAALRDDAAFRDELTETMRRHGLQIGGYLGQDYGPGETFDWSGSIDDSDPEPAVRSLHDATERGRGWTRLVELLEAAPSDAWRNLHIWKTWPASEAIAAERGFAFDVLAPLLLDLSGLYLQVVERALGRSIWK